MLVQSPTGTVNLQQFPLPPDHGSQPPDVKVIRPSRLARVLGWLLAAVFLAAAGAAAMVGFITFTVLFVLLVPVLLLLLVLVLILGRARFQIHIVRRYRTPRQGGDGSSGANRNP
jgi:hypothetical protein